MFVFISFLFILLQITLVYSMQSDCVSVDLYPKEEMQILNKMGYKVLYNPESLKQIALKKVLELAKQNNCLGTVELVSPLICKNTAQSSKKLIILLLFIKFSSKVPKILLRVNPFFLRTYDRKYLFAYDEKETILYKTTDTELTEIRRFQGGIASVTHDHKYIMLDNAGHVYFLEMPTLVLIPVDASFNRASDMIELRPNHTWHILRDFLKSIPEGEAGAITAEERMRQGNNCHPESYLCIGYHAPFHDNAEFKYYDSMCQNYDALKSVDEERLKQLPMSVFLTSSFLWQIFADHIKRVAKVSSDTFSMTPDGRYALFGGVYRDSQYRGCGFSDDTRANKLVLVDFCKLDKKEGYEEIDFKATGSIHVMELSSNGRFALIKIGDDSFSDFFPKRFAPAEELIKFGGTQVVLYELRAKKWTVIHQGPIGYAGFTLDGLGIFVCDAYNNYFIYRLNDYPTSLSVCQLSFLEKLDEAGELQNSKKVLPARKYDKLLKLAVDCFKQHPLELQKLLDYFNLKKTEA